MNTAVQVDATYDRKLLEAAATCYIRGYFRGIGRWLLVACVINAIGFGAAIALGAKSGPVMWWVVFIVVAGPLYCAYLFWGFPRRYSSRAIRVFAPTTRISFTVATVEFSCGQGAASIPWGALTKVRECPTAFLLVLSQLIHSFMVVPKAGLPNEAREFLASKVVEHAG
jgi:hypothetical protein